MPRHYLDVDAPHPSDDAPLHTLGTYGPEAGERERAVTDAMAELPPPVGSIRANPSQARTDRILLAARMYRSAAVGGLTAGERDAVIAEADALMQPHAGAMPGLLERVREAADDPEGLLDAETAFAKWAGEPARRVS